MITKIEIEFELPIELSDEEMQWLDKFCGRICKRECPDGWAFWSAGFGSRPNFSQADQRFLGKEVDPNAPAAGEPTWDDTVYHIDCAARELYPEEIEARKQKAMKAEERAARWDAKLAHWLHVRGLKRASWLVADISFWVQRKTRWARRTA
jgi:hypothetical protein